MINYIKNEIKHLPFTVLVFVLLYGIVTFATNYAFDSSDVRFDNTGTSLDSVNVQDALDETFHHVTDYNEIKTTIGNGSLTTTSQNIIGAVNEVNGKVTTYRPSTSYTNASDIKTMLQTLVNSMSEAQTKNVLFTTGSDTSLSPFSAWDNYSGYVTKINSTGTYWIAHFISFRGTDIEVGCNNGTITVYSLSDQITNDIWKSVEITFTNVDINIQGKAGYYASGQSMTIPAGYIPISATYKDDFSTGVFPVIYYTLTNVPRIALVSSTPATGVTLTILVHCVRENL